MLECSLPLAERRIGADDRFKDTTDATPRADHVDFWRIPGVESALSTIKLAHRELILTLADIKFPIGLIHSPVGLVCIREDSNRREFQARIREIPVPFRDANGRRIHDPSPSQQRLRDRKTNIRLPGFRVCEPRWQIALGRQSVDGKCPAARERKSEARQELIATGWFALLQIRHDALIIAGVPRKDGRLEFRFLGTKIRPRNVRRDKLRLQFEVPF